MKHAEIAQSVERVHGKDEVPGSIPGLGSRIKSYPVGNTRVDKVLSTCVLMKLKDWSQVQIYCNKCIRGNRDPSVSYAGKNRRAPDIHIVVMSANRSINTRPILRNGEKAKRLD